MLEFIFLMIGLFTAKASVINWVMGNRGESHTEACSRSGYFPTNRTIIFEVNKTSMLDLIHDNFMTYSVDSKIIRGCCVSSVWCSKSTKICFTQAYGSFYENYGLLNGDIDSSPVFSCYSSYSSSNNLKSPSISSIYFDDTGSLTYTGKYLGSVENKIVATLAGENCDNPEICSKICSSCSDTLPCPLDSECLNVGQGPRCFMFCAGPTDTSCPCDTFCDQVQINSYSGSVSVHLCTPVSFQLSNGNVCANYLNSGNERVQCSIPRASQISALPYTTNFSFAVEEKYSVGNKQALILKWCRADSQCHDGNICTVDTCVNARCGDTFDLKKDVTSNNFTVFYILNL